MRPAHPDPRPFPGHPGWVHPHGSAGGTLRLQTGQTLGLLPSMFSRILGSQRLRLIFPDSWIQEVQPPNFPTQQHCQSLSFPGGAKRESSSGKGSVLLVNERGFMIDLGFPGEAGQH